MKKKKVCILSASIIFLANFLMQENGIKSTDYQFNSLSLANIEALTQGESGQGELGDQIQVDSVDMIYDTYSTLTIEGWKCASDMKDIKKYVVKLTRSCGNKGLIPCKAGTCQVGDLKTEERDCIHVREV